MLCSLITSWVRLVPIRSANSLPSPARPPAVLSSVGISSAINGVHSSDLHAGEFNQLFVGASLRELFSHVYVLCFKNSSAWDAGVVLRYERHIRTGLAYLEIHIGQLTAAHSKTACVFKHNFHGNSLA